MPTRRMPPRKYHSGDRRERAKPKTRVLYAIYPCKGKLIDISELSFARIPGSHPNTNRSLFDRSLDWTLGILHDVNTHVVCNFCIEGGGGYVY